MNAGRITQLTERPPSLEDLYGPGPYTVTVDSTTTPDPIIEAVRAKLLGRSARGIAKYGTTLARHDLSYLDWLRHLQEELLDAAGYLERLIQDAEGNTPIP